MYTQTVNTLDINMGKYVEIINEYFSEDDINVILEVGALDAKDSLFFKKHFPNSNVYAIEGLPDNYNTYMSNLSDITCINAVINNYDGVTEYHVKNTNGIHSIFDRGSKYGTKIITLPCYKLKTLCENYNIEKIDMMKIDVEGATYQILKSMDDMLENVKIMHIEAETHPYFKNQILLNDVFDFLTNKNFKLIELSYVVIDEHGKQSDSVWINKKYLKS